MNIFTYMRTHAHNKVLPLLCVCVCVGFIREFATGAPRFIVHTYTIRRMCIHMGDIKAIDAKHFATGYA